MTLAAGCARSGPPKPAMPPEQAAPEPISAVVGKGEHTSKMMQELWWVQWEATVWTIRWDQARLDYASDLQFAGKMENVAGTIYQNDEPVSDYTADFGEVKKEDREVKLLTVYGHVTVTAREKGGGKLTCDRLDWLPLKGLMAAKGKVNFKSDSYGAGEFPELWATPDIAAPGGTIGTPDQFADWPTGGGK